MSETTYFIYAIRHNKTKRMYIGCTKNPSRLNCHMSQLSREVHYSVGLREDYENHGADFTFYLLETLLDNDRGSYAREREAYWIHYYGTDIPERGYNSPSVYLRIPITKFPVIIPNPKVFQIDYSHVEESDGDEQSYAMSGD